MRSASMPVEEVGFILRIRMQPRRIILAVLLGWAVRASVEAARLVL